MNTIRTAARKRSSIAPVLRLCFTALVLTWTATASSAGFSPDPCANAVVPSACRWALVGGNGSGQSATITQNAASVSGSICGETTRVDRSVAVIGDVVATASSGRGAEFGPSAAVEGDIVTGGASIVGSSGRVRLPGLNSNRVPSGSCNYQLGDPSCALDATGPNPLVAVCQDAIDSIPKSIVELNSTSFRRTAFLSWVKIPNGETLTIKATGPLNVIDMIELDVKDGATLILDGNSIPDVTFVVRVDRRVYLHFESSLVLAGGATAERTILYGRGDCRVGEAVTGAGTLFCPYEHLTVQHNTFWQGSLVSGSERTMLRSKVDLVHVPLLISLP